MAKTARFLTNNDYYIFEEFIKPHTAEAFFLRSNTERVGLEYNGGTFSAEYIGVFEDAELKAVLAFSWMNTILACAPHVPDLQYTIPLLKDIIVQRGGQIEAICTMKPEGDYIASALNLPISASRKDETEYLYILNMDDLPAQFLNAPTAQTRPAKTKDFDILCAWRADFSINFLGAQKGDKLTQSVRAEITRKIDEGELFVLETNDEIVSFAGVGGFIPKHLHIGPVYTPPEHRGKGYARYLLAGAFMLQNQARGESVKTAGLFAANPSAIKTYESLGFVQSGQFRLNLIREDFRYNPFVL
jgi:GNAT superfamily N-acetyltransferase